MSARQLGSIQSITKNLQPIISAAREANNVPISGARAELLQQAKLDNRPHFKPGYKQVWL